MSRSWRGGAWGDPEGALGGLDPAPDPERASRGPGLFDSRGFLWSLFDLIEDGPREASKACALRVGQPCLLTEVIFSKSGWLTRWIWRF